MLKSRKVIAITSLSSNNASSWPMQLRGPNSKGRHAPFTGYRGSSSETSQRSGTNESCCGQYIPSLCIAWCVPQTVKPSVGYMWPSCFKKNPRSPSRVVEAAGKSLRVSLMIASVNGNRLSKCGFAEITSFICVRSDPKTLSCSARTSLESRGIAG